MNIKVFLFLFLFAKQSLRKIINPSLWVSVCDCPSSDSSETIKVIIIKFGMVTAWDMIKHHMLMILTLMFIQGHTDIILSIWLFQKVFKQCPSCLLRSPTKGLYNLFSVRWPWSCIQTWHEGRLRHGIYTDGHFDDLDLDARSQWIGRGRNSELINEVL